MERLDHRLTAALQQRDNTGIVGRNATSNIITYKTQKFANVFASRFQPDLQSTQLKAELEPTLNITIDYCIKLQSYKLQITTFNVATRCDDPSIFMQVDTWPADCYVQRMHKPQQANANVNSARSERMHNEDIRYNDCNFDSP